MSFVAHPWCVDIRFNVVTDSNNKVRVLRKLLKIVETVVMMMAIVSIYNCVRYVCIITDPEEPRCMLYRQVTGAVVVLGAVLAWIFI